MNPEQTPQRRTEIINRRDKVAELYLHGASQYDIAQELGVNQATISRDLQELRKEWLERSINHIDQKKAIELAKLDRLEMTYWDGYVRSMQDAEINVTEQVGNRRRPRPNEPEPPAEGIIPQSIKKIKRTEGRVGNPAFLDGVLKCITKRCEILGLDAPKTVKNVNVDWTTLTEDQLKRIANGDDIATVLSNQS